MGGRIDSHTMFFGMLDNIAERSTCRRAKVGALLAKDGRPISMGYNGAPPKMPECITEGVGCEYTQATVAPHGPEDPERVTGWLEGCDRTVHAEANAIAFAARHGIATQGTTMYCTHAPCYSCAKLMLSAGITDFRYKKEYRDERGLTLLTQAGVLVTKYV